MNSSKVIYKKKIDSAHIMPSKTITGKLSNLTTAKQKALDFEYNNLQSFLQKFKEAQEFGDEEYFLENDKTKLYSANKQQALRFYKKKKLKAYPLSIRNDLLKIERTGNKISKYWVRLPVSKKRGGIWCAFKTYTEIPKDVKLCESKLVKKKGNYYLHITIKKDVTLTSFNNILAIDLGEKHIATTVLQGKNISMNPKFYGKKVRRIRRHYAWLRKRLGNKKLLKEIKRIGHTEKRKVNDILHKISRDIVQQAEENNACIVLGDLKGIRKSAKGKGKRFNRIVANMPYHKLTQYIQYKAEWKGIQVKQISERNTSKTCHKCGQKGNRKTQGLFVCDCGLQYNADLNGALNIAKRFEDYTFSNGVVSEPTQNQSQTLETPQLVEG
jgi:putative transposase